MQRKPEDRYISTLPIEILFNIYKDARCCVQKKKEKRIFFIFFSFVVSHLASKSKFSKYKIYSKYRFFSKRFESEKYRNIENDGTEVDICRFLGRHSPSNFWHSDPALHCESLVDKHRIPLFSAWLILMSRESSRFLQFRATGNASNFRISGLRLGNGFFLFF